MTIEQRFEKFVTFENRWPAGLALFLFISITYGLTAQTPFFSPVTVFVSPIDKLVPLIPWTIWIYISEYPLLALAFLSISDTPTLRGYMKGMIFIQMVAISVFLVFPTIFPQESVVLPEGTDMFSAFAFRTVKAIDNPTNCLPSLHVADCFFSSFIFLQSPRRKLFWVLFIWAAVVALSTMTTKQHYFLDGVAGTLLAVVAFQRYIHKPLTNP